MKIKYDVTVLARIIGDLSKISNLAISFLDSNFNALISVSPKNDFCSILQSSQKEFSNNCRCSDIFLLKKCAKSRKLEKHICHAGFLDVAMPIIKDEDIVGYVIFGRIRTPKSVIRSEYKEFDDLYERSTLLTSEQIDSLCDLMPNILFNTAIITEEETLIENFTSYINEHFSKHISVEFLCNKFNVNKNKLYLEVSTSFGKTVNEYITDVRLQNAKKLLLNTDLSVSSIAESVGIQNHTYFIKLFKSKVGLTPFQYRKSGNSQL